MLQTSLTEMMYISFAAYLLTKRVLTLVATDRGESCSIDAAVICPSRIKVQTEHITVSCLQSCIELLKVSHTVPGAGIIIATAPAITIKPHTWCIHTAVQHHMITIGIHQPFAFHME